MRWPGTILILVASGFFALLGIGHLVAVENAEKLWARGKPAEGTLTAHHGRRKSNMSEYTYDYRVGDQGYTAERRSVPWSARELPIGARLEVRYDPEDPDRSITPAELEEARKWPNKAFFFVVSAAFLGWAVRRIVKRPAEPPKAT